jgi:hypothetical protein
MNVRELYDQFRDDMVDTVKPYLWSDREVFRYMDDAYSMFVRLTGGIADDSSDATRAEIVTGESAGVLDKSILRVMSARRVSDSGKINVINQFDTAQQRDHDYNRDIGMYDDNTPGVVRYMTIGRQRGSCVWVQVPTFDDVAQMSVYRLPTTKIDGKDASFEFEGVEAEHHTSLCMWMRHLGYTKADAETFDKGRADAFAASFKEYCSFSKAEWERYKHKNRAVAYGGL